MKVLVSGKGGSGKSTVSVLLAIALRDRGFKVLLVDADESNHGLHRLLGISYPVPLLENLGGKSGFKTLTASAFPQASNTVPFKDQIKIDDIPNTCISEDEGIKLLVIGKIHDFGEGCACPMGALSRMFLSKLDLNTNEIVIIDAAAGVEHFGRRIDADCDMILGIVDPTFESFTLVKKMREMATRAGVDMFFALNKVDENIRGTMLKHIEQTVLIAEIPYNPNLFIDNLEGKKLKKSCFNLDPACELIEKLKTQVSHPNFFVTS